MPKQRRIIIIAGPNGAGKTTFAREYLLKEARLIPRWRTAGYRVRLIFLSLPTPEIAIARVATRVAQGGHNVRSTVIRRRFDSGLHNFQNVYMDLVDRWVWYDNSGNLPRLISEGRN